MLCATLCFHGLVLHLSGCATMCHHLTRPPHRFPFLFYSTTYVGQVMAYQLGKEPDIEIATRTGEFAMLLYSIGMFLYAPFYCSLVKQLRQQWLSLRVLPFLTLHAAILVYSLKRAMTNRHTFSASALTFTSGVTKLSLQGNHSDFLGGQSSSGISGWVLWCSLRY